MEACPEHGQGRAPAMDLPFAPRRTTGPCTDGSRVNDGQAPFSTGPILRSVARVFAMSRSEDRALQKFNALSGEPFSPPSPERVSREHSQDAKGRA
jgi:hypothetical protein